MPVIERFDPYDGELGFALATRVDDIVHVAGMTGVNEADRSAPEGLEAQLRLAYQNINMILDHFNMFEAESSKAWTRTGTSRPAHRRVFATARSSPKLGSVTSTPSISSPCFRKQSAYRRASCRLSTAPLRVASSGSSTALMPSRSSTWENGSPTRRTEMIRKEPPVAHEDAQRHWSGCIPFEETVPGDGRAARFHGLFHGLQPETLAAGTRPGRLRIHEMEATPIQAVRKIEFGAN